MTADEALNRVLRRLGVKLPAVGKPVGVYQPLVVSGGFGFLSGQISKDSEGKILTGRVGADLTLEDGRRAAQWAVLQALSVVQSGLGLAKVEQVARLAGYVQAAAEFHRESEVMNAASELLVEVFGDYGRHARTSVGVAGLPLNAAVEIELTLGLR